MKSNYKKTWIWLSLGFVILLIFLFEPAFHFSSKQMLSCNYCGSRLHKHSNKLGYNKIKPELSELGQFALKTDSPCPHNFQIGSHAEYSLLHRGVTRYCYQPGVFEKINFSLFNEATRTLNNSQLQDLLKKLRNADSNTAKQILEQLIDDYFDNI